MRQRIWFRLACAGEQGRFALQVAKPSIETTGTARRLAAWMLWCVLCFLMAGPSSASGGAFSGYSHTAWSLNDGAPADIWAIAQSDDGYLWLGTGFGLYRFDGVRFERFQPVGGTELPSNNITALTILPSGDIWIGHYLGGMTRLRNGRARYFGTNEGLPSAMVYRIAEDPSGGLWAAIGSGLLHYKDGRWLDARVSADYPHDSAYWVEFDATGAMWIATRDTVVVRPAGSDAFVATDAVVSIQAVLATAPDGTVWVSDAKHGTRPLRQQANGRYRDAMDEFPVLADVEAVRMYFHDDGSLWGTRRGHGVFRAAFPQEAGRAASATLQSFSSKGGLTSDTAVPLFRDREGNLWFGTILGLNRFRYRNVVSLPKSLAPTGGYDMAIHGDDGSVLIASSSGRLMAIDRAAMRRILDGGGIDDEIARTHTDAWWLHEGQEVWRFNDGHAARVDFPGSCGCGTVDAMAMDHMRHPWVSVRDDGVYIRRDDRWLRQPSVPLPAPTVIAAGIDGRMWFGYKDGRVAVLDGDKVEVHAASNIGLGPVTAIHAGRRHNIVAGEKGIARLEAMRFLPIIGDGEFSGITGILESDEDLLWLNGSKGVLRVDGRDLATAARSSGRIPSYVLFDQADGLPGVALQTKPTSTALNADGLFWFSTNGGVALIDPERIRINRLRPDVHVLAIASGSTVTRFGAAPIVLPPRTTEVQVSYTATSLSAPERVRFRYRLEGVDDDWRDAGTRREAFYTNLGPGDYRFRVIAANNDGVWNEEGDTVAFRIRPTFFQSAWFALACVLLLAAALWIGYLLHLRQLAMRMRARLDERHMERERIARELHDTLLQSVQGLILRLHALTSKMDAGSAPRQGLESVMERAESVLAEGRDRVHGLRIISNEIDLPAALAAVEEEFAEPGRPALELVVLGQPRSLQPLVRDELYRLGREAMVNAYRHAQASRIRVEVDYASDGVRLEVEDDGVGIDPEILDRGDRPGHWGLAGMRERTEWMGGRFAIASRPGNGTTILAIVPASRAYLRRRRWLGRLLKWKP